MGRLAIIRALAGVLFLGSAALAQQGLIIEPWRKPPAPVALPVRPTRVMPASGLPAASKAAPRIGSSNAAASAATSDASGTSGIKWLPPVVELLVDPWAKLHAFAAPASPPWVPQSREIIDPWAHDSEPQPPVRVAARPAEGSVRTARSTIF